jgi:hypothetical protein
VAHVVAPVAATVHAVAPSTQGVVAPVLDGVSRVTNSAVVSTVVTPVAQAADRVVDALPVANRLLGADPIESLTAPVTGTVDGLVGGVGTTVSGVVHPVVGAVGEIVDPVTSSVTRTVGLEPSIRVPGEAVTTSSAPLTVAPRSAVAVSPVVWTVTSAPAGWSTLARAHYTPSDAVTSISTTPGTPWMPAAPGQPTNVLGSMALGAGSTAGAGGQGSSSASADFASFGSLTRLTAGTGHGAGNDVLPSSPTADHDISPD